MVFFLLGYDDNCGARQQKKNMKEILLISNARKDNKAPKWNFSSSLASFSQKNIKTKLESRFMSFDSACLLAYSPALFLSTVVQSVRE